MSSDIPDIINRARCSSFVALERMNGNERVNASGGISDGC